MTSLVTESRLLNRFLFASRQTIKALLNGAEYPDKVCLTNAQKLTLSPKRGQIVMTANAPVSSAKVQAKQPCVDHHRRAMPFSMLHASYVSVG